jgi:hypothetical protein
MIFLHECNIIWVGEKWEVEWGEEVGGDTEWRRRRVREYMCMGAHPQVSKREERADARYGGKYTQVYHMKVGGCEEVWIWGRWGYVSTCMYSD